MVIAGGGEGGNKELAFDEYRASVWQDEKVQRDGGEGHTTM